MIGHPPRDPRRRFVLPLVAFAILLGIAVSSQQHAGDRFAGNGDLVLLPGEVVEHDAVALNGRVVVPQGARVGHDVRTANGAVEIDGQVDHDVTTLNGSVQLGPHARIGHEVTAANGTIQKDPAAQVGGRAVAAPAPPAAPGLGGVLGFVLRLLINLVLGTIFVAVGTLAVLAWPRQVGRVTSVLEGTPWAAVGVGVISAIFMPPVVLLLSLILVITIIGIPVALVLWTALFVGWLYGMVAVGLWAGRRIADSGRLPAARNSLLLTALVGLVSLSIMLLLLDVIASWLAWPAAYLLGCIGLGAVVLSRLGVAGHLPRRAPATGPRATHPLSPPSDRIAS
ncbi:MAG TPA: hypothetical protein VM536_13130 [Chloroflexia bacterium]|nr:hypothetical protein [Chloroflexia bacterium]